MSQMLHTLPQRRATAGDQDQHGDDEGPEVDLHAVAEGMCGVWTVAAAFVTEQQEALIDGIGG